MGFFGDLFSSSANYDDADFDFERENVTSSTEAEKLIKNSETPVQDYIREFGYGSRKHIVALAEFLEVTEEEAFTRVSREMRDVSGSAIPGFAFDEDPDFEAMSGEEFEKYLEELFEANGLRVKMTPKSGDQGADLIVNEYDKKTVIQAKNMMSNVGNSAVQEVKAALDHYDADEGIVICTSGYTSSAEKLADSNDIELWDKSELIKAIEGEKNIRDIVSLRIALEAIKESEARDNFINCHLPKSFVGGFTWDDYLMFSNRITERNVTKTDVEHPVEREKARLEHFLKKKNFEKKKSHTKLNEEREFFRKDTGKSYEADDMFYLRITDEISEVEKFFYQYLVDFCKEDPAQIQYEVNT